MYKLLVHKDAVEDLKEIRGKFPAVADEVLVLMQELKGSQDLMDRLSQNWFGEDGRGDFGVRLLKEQNQLGNNLWRLKLWALETAQLKYRIIYAFLPHAHEYVVLGVMDRSVDYERNHPFIQRIEATYAAL